MHSKNLNKSKKNVRLCKVRIEKNCEKKKKNFVFIGLVNFLGGTFEVTHAFSHSCLPFLNVFDHIMHFCESSCATLIGTYRNSLQIFFSIITYWQALENA